MGPIELACTCTKLDRVQTASQLVCGLGTCYWLECISDLHVYKASDFGMQVLLDFTFYKGVCTTVSLMVLRFKGFCDNIGLLLPL